MSESRLPDHLDHMRDAARQACDYTIGMSKDEFLADRKPSKPSF
jgi:uncharacterized protein with HEPN domain